MSCPEPDRVLAYLARRLAAADCAALEAHVDVCRECRVLLVELAGAGEVGLVERERDPDAVGRYRIDARLGEGGMGTVYAAHDPQLDRRVAIKLVHADLASRGGVDRLVREGRALARLAHPNVVAVHDAGLDGDRVYIAMELVEGQTLASWLAAEPRSWRAITEAFIAAGRGLAAAHAAGIVHRDVKPENILVDRRGIPKVTDFGLASASPPDAERRTAAGAMATPRGPSFAAIGGLVARADVPRVTVEAVARSGDAGAAPTADVDRSCADPAPAADVDRGDEVSEEVSDGLAGGSPAEAERRGGVGTRRADHVERRAVSSVTDAAASSAVASRLTRPGGIVGTPALMSPEQRSGGRVGPATDQYSLCAAMASALEGVRSPRWLRRALARGMARDPEARFPTVDALLAALAGPRWRLPVAIGATVTAAAAIAFAAWPRGGDELAEACEEARAASAAVWTPADRDAIAGAMRATRLGFAEASAHRASTEIDGYVAAIHEAEAAICVRAAGRDEVLELRRLGLACLADRRAALSRAIARLRTSGPSEVRTAVLVVHELDNVEECADVGALANELAIRADPAQLAARARSIEAVRVAKAATVAGNYREAAQSAARAVAEARAVGGVVLVKALIAKAELGQLADGFGASEAAYREAITVAERIHTDELRALAMAGLMAVRAREPGRERDALAMRSLVDASVERAGKRAVLAPMIDQAAGLAQLRLGQLSAAVASFEAALAAARAALAPGDPRLPEYIYPVGLALSHQRKDRQALRHHEEAYRIAVGAWGQGHPNAERFAINLAVKHASLGDCALALVELARARTSLAAVLPADSPELVSIGEITGTCHTLQGNHAAALREHEAVQRALIAAGRERSVEMGQAWLDIGDAHLDRGDLAPAISAFEKSVATYEPLVGTTDVRLALPLAHLGDAELRARRPTARARLERAHALFIAADTPALTAADAAFPLARALWDSPGDRARARGLATSARAAYATGGPIVAKRLAEVDAWLRAHP